MNTKKISIIEAITKRDLKLFINFPRSLYKQEKYYIPALQNEELANHSIITNPMLEFCEVKYWLAIKNRTVVGRVAAIIDDAYNTNQRKRYLKFGWLDFYNDEEVISKLMQVVEDWGSINGVEYIIGPMGFTTFDRSGVLIEGFTETPTIYSNYNYQYYGQMIEKCGYSKETDWVEYNVKVPDSIPEKYVNGASIIKKRYNLSVLELKSKNDLLNYADAIFEMLNKEYVNSYGFNGFNEIQVDKIVENYLRLLRLDFVCLVVDSTQKLVGFGICLPSLSKAIKKSNGYLYPFGIFRIQKALKHNDTVDTLLIAIEENYKNKGVNGIIFNELIGAFQRNGITNIETNKETESNTQVQNLWKKFDYRQHKRSRCYIKKMEYNA
ncbi:MAG TPA: N-acetyltransferase [Bacteroidales bacterium]|nr:N-acetyltransferase [Bacteroidales bacterium]